MPWYRMRTDLGGPLGGVFHLCGKRLSAPCSACGYVSTRLCDWKMPGGGDCDRPLCSYCTTSPAPQKDLCPQHALAWKAWLAARTNSTEGAGP